MERRCPQCGATLHGRIDKKFCSDGCRSDYHNERRREQEKELRRVNQILAANWRLLTRQLQSGQTEVPAAELAARNFNFDLYTASRRQFPGQRIYWCYNCSYRITRSGIVHICRSGYKNNAYI